MAQVPEPMQSQVKLDNTVGQAGYSVAFDNAALTPSFLGQLGASMALTASQEINKRRGINAGMNPTGDVLPPITAADKAYVDAYKNQSQATLTNQAQVLFDKSQENMAMLGKISPNSIAEYQKTLHEGLSDILDLAPSDVKASLANQFTQQIESSRHHYTMQMQSQQKAESLARSNTALSQITKQIHDAALDGKSELSEQLYKDSLTMIERGAASNIYSPSQAETLKSTARMTLLSSQEIRKGVDAKRAGKMDTYLTDLADENKKPGNISWSDWESIRSNSAKYLRNIKSLESQHEQLIASNGYVDIAQGTMTAEKMEQIKGELNESPLLFNNLAIAFSTQQRRNQSAQASSDYYAQHWQNIDELRNASPKDINKAFSSLVNLKKQQAEQSGNPISQEEAEYQIAAASAIPVPGYNKKLGDYLTSGNPELMTQGLQDFKRLNQFQGNKTVGVLGNSKAMAMMSKFDGFLKQGKDSQTAAAMAQDIVYNKTPEQIAMSNAQTQIILNKHGSTPSSLSSWVNSIADVASDTHVVNQAALNSAIVGMFKNNMQWTNGDEEASKAMITDGFHKAWGTSEINGRKEMTFLPPEKSIGLDVGAVPLMQIQIADQIKLQAEDTKRAFDQGFSEFYIDVKPRPDFEAYIEAKNTVRTKGLRDSEYAKHSKVIAEFEKGEPVELERIYRNGTKESFSANIQPNSFQGIDPKSGELKGDYDIGLINSKTGLPEPFIGIFGSTRITPVYRPNIGEIKARYLAVNGINPQNFSEIDIKKRIDAFKLRLENEDQSTISKTLNSTGRGFR